MSAQTAQPLRPAQILLGHTSPDTAYIIEDYPYGSYEHCRMRQWIDTVTSGPHARQQRWARQTTNPAFVHERWKKPRRGTYAQLAVLYLDAADHLRCFTVTEHVTALDDAYLRVLGIYDHLDDRQHARYQQLLAVSQQREQPWREFAETVAALAAHLDTTGTPPELTNGVWQTPGRSFVLGHHLPLYLAVVQHHRTTS